MLALETNSVGSSSSVTEEGYSSRVVLDVERQVTHSKSQILISDLCWVGLFWTKPTDHRSEKGEESSGTRLPALTPVSRQRRVWKKSRLLGKTTCRKRESPIPVSETL
jgi:hypothetical protein